MGAEQTFRDEQCKVIGSYIAQQRALSREDILLVGDFNMIPGQDISNFHHLGGNDLMDFLSSWDLQDRYSHILPKGRANLLDGFAISRNYSTELYSWQSSHLSNALGNGHGQRSFSRRSVGSPAFCGKF